jgi:hypothetical protein
MNGENGNTKPADPFEAFRSIRDSYFDSMSKVMIDAVNSEEYAQATGAMLNGALTASAPFREGFDKAVAAGLAQSQLPSRQELAALAERFTHVEMRLDDMDAKLDRIAEMLSASQGLPKQAAPQTHSGGAKSPNHASHRKGQGSL